MLALLASILFFFFPTCAMAIANKAAEVVPQSCDTITCPSGYEKVLPLDPAATPTQQTCCVSTSAGLAAAQPPAPPPCPHTAEQILNDALNTILALTTSTTTSTTTASAVPCTTHEHLVKESVAKEILEKALKDIAQGSSSSADKATKVLEQVFSTTTVTSTVTTTTVTRVMTTVTSTSPPREEPSKAAPCEKPPKLAVDPTIDVVNAVSKLAASLATPAPCVTGDTSASLEAALSKLQAVAQARKAINGKTAAALAVDPTATVSAMEINAISTGQTEALATELPKSASIRRATPPAP